MPGVLVLAVVRFKEDTEPYTRYVAAFPEVFANSGGTLVGVADSPKQIDGSATDADKMVLLRFDDEAAARSFFGSPAYQRIAIDRDAGANVTSYLINEV
jgi:uncharacterized protein (DUF1330 family)